MLLYVHFWNTISGRIEGIFFYLKLFFCRIFSQAAQRQWDSRSQFASRGGSMGPGRRGKSWAEGRPVGGAGGGRAPTLPRQPERGEAPVMLKNPESSLSFNISIFYLPSYLIMLYVSRNLTLKFLISTDEKLTKLVGKTRGTWSLVEKRNAVNRFQ